MTAINGNVFAGHVRLLKHLAVIYVNDVFMLNIKKMSDVLFSLCMIFDNWCAKNDMMEEECFFYITSCFRIGF